MSFDRLLETNRIWAEKIIEEDPHFFENLSKQQKPEYLWIGCSDSRVPANQIAGIAPGEVFVHRNVANIVVHSDLNCLSVIQFAVDVLKVKHILVVGHYGCSGITAALEGARLGLVDNWLLHVKDIFERHQLYLQDNIPLRSDRLCELNVIEQVRNICQTVVVQDAWHRGQKFTVHGCIYGLRNGLLHDLNTHISAPSDIEDTYQRAIHAIYGQCIC